MERGRLKAEAKVEEAWKELPLDYPTAGYPSLHMASFRPFFWLFTNTCSSEPKDVPLIAGPLSGHWIQRSGTDYLKPVTIAISLGPRGSCPTSSEGRGKPPPPEK